MKLLTRLFTKNLKSIPLFIVNFNYKDYKKGIIENCIIKYHPVFYNDKELQEKFTDIVDYIRENYDMGDLV